MPTASSELGSGIAKAASAGVETELKISPEGLKAIVPETPTASLATSLESGLKSNPHKTLAELPQWPTLSEVKPPTTESPAQIRTDSSSSELPKQSAGIGKSAEGFKPLVAEANSTTPVSGSESNPSITQDKLSDQESRIRFGEDWRVKTGELTQQQVNEARAARAAATPEGKTAAAQQKYDSLKEKPYKDLTPEDKKFMTDHESAKVSVEDKQWYDQTKEKPYGQLSAEDKKRMEAIEGKLEGDKPLSAEQIEQKRAELVNNIVDGKNIDQSLKELRQLNEQKAGSGLNLTEAERKKIVEKILNPETNNAAMQEVRRNMIEMKQIEMQLMMQAQTLELLREQRGEAIKNAKQAVKDADRMNIDKDDNLTAKAEARDKAYGAMMTAMQKRAQISFVKLNTGKLLADYNDKNQFVMRKTGVTGGMGAMIDMVGAKVGLVGAEIGYQVNSRVDGSIFDADESIHIPGIGLITG